MITNVFSSLLHKVGIKTNRADSYKYYERLLDHFNNKQAYIGLQQDYLDKDKVESNQLISLFPTYQIKNISPALLKSKYGKQHFKKSYSIKGERITIYIHKIMLGGQKVKLYTHFVKNQLFYFQYTFSYLNADEKTTMEHILKTKYVPNASFTLTNNYIQNKDGVVLFCNNEVDYSLHYIDSENMFIKQLYKHLYKTKRHTVHKQKQEIKQLFQSL